VAPRTDPRAVADHLDRDVADGEAGVADELRRRGEELRARRPRPPRVGGAEAGAEVPEAGGGEEGVARGVGGDVAVGVPPEADLTRPLEAGDEQRSVAARGGEGVDVGPDPGARQHAGQRSAGQAGGGSRSALSLRTLTRTGSRRSRPTVRTTTTPTMPQYSAALAVF